MVCLAAQAQDSTAAVAPEGMLDARLDSVEVSVLTCTPGSDLYAKFGHTALRVKDFTRGADVVFNYGCFDGSANDFVFKFLLGQTDYLLQDEPFDYLVARYGTWATG